jgi:two-component system chemotaxis response regulator CheB
MIDRTRQCIDELRARPPHAVVFGGSAGSIDALKVLLPALPLDLAVPVLGVVHLAPETQAIWNWMFEDARVPVCEAEDKDQAEPGKVYMAPPNYHLLVDKGGTLQLSIDARVQFARPSIDVLFESAAWAYSTRLLALVLSGANSDGANGLRAVAGAGGHTWAQAPDSAIAPLMPRSALEAVPKAWGLELDEMVAVFQSGVLAANRGAASSR